MQQIKIKENFEIIDYVTIVEAIVTEYFDEDGNYTPHIGLLNAMKVFYNDCIIESKYDVEHNIVEALQMESFVNDKDFINAFNESITYTGEKCLNFANAYRDALDIVDTKKNSIGTMVDMMRSGFTKIVEKINPILNEDNIAKLSKIAEDISSGNLSADSIVEAYGNSKIMKMPKKE